jgi:hypothetical protein
MNMDNFKSYQFTFLYLMNKCLLLFKYIDTFYQKEILNEIKVFINKLQEIFAKSDFKNNIEKKNKIFELLIDYFKIIINKKIYNLINSANKAEIIASVEKSAMLLCNTTNNDTDKLLNNFINSNLKDIYPKDREYPTTDYNLIDSIHSNFKETHTKDREKLQDQNPKNKRNDDLLILETKINNKIKLIFNEIENNIKRSLKEYTNYTQYVEYDLDKKFNEKIEDIQSKLKDILNDNNRINDGKISNNIDILLKDQINDIYKFIDNKILDIKDNNTKDIEYKIKLLGNIFNENLQKVFANIDNRFIDNEQELIRIIENKINNSNFNKNNFNIIFDKELNEIKLLYCDEVVTSTKINIKGLIGPKGPPGNKGDKGETPIIRKISITPENKMKFIFQEGNNIYEIVTDDKLPTGPQGIQGIKGEPGKSILDLKWNQDNVMRIDNENSDSLIFLKSLCIGENSHCLKNNSFSIGGAICYQNDSIGVGPNSKTLDSESIAFYGTCIGKKAFSYRADNVDENTVEFGKKEKNSYNINSFNLNSKEINLDCDILKIKTNKYENSKFKELEEKYIYLEKKVLELYKKI